MEEKMSLFLNQLLNAQRFLVIRWRGPIVNVVPAFKKHWAKGKDLGSLPDICFSRSHGMDEITDREKVGARLGKCIHSGSGRRAREDEED